MNPRRWTLVALSFLAALALTIDVVWSGWRSTGSLPTLPWRAHVLALLVFVLETLARATKVQWGARALRIPLRWLVALQIGRAHV